MSKINWSKLREDLSEVTPTIIGIGIFWTVFWGGFHLLAEYNPLNIQAEAQGGVLLVYFLGLTFGLIGVLSIVIGYVKFAERYMKGGESKNLRKKSRAIGND